MASGGHEYTLVGFSDGLDRRPLFFVEPLPATRLCSACGLVPSVKALLPCEHFFCKPCYEQCERSGRVTCPLDGDTCSDEEVVWINHPTRSILSKQVLCWNQSNGCNVVRAAADICKHFHHECEHHLVTCPKCRAGIFASDVCVHLECRCDASGATSAAAVQPRETVCQEQEPLDSTCSELSDGFQRIYNAISRAMSSFQAELKEISSGIKIGVAPTTARHGETGEGILEAGTLQESLSQVRIQTAKLKDQLDEFMRDVNANQQTFHNSFVEKHEALKQSLTHTLQSTIDQTELAAQFSAFRAATEDMHRETKAELDRHSLGIDGKYDRISELLGNTNASLERLVRNSQGSAEPHAERLAQNASEIAWAKTSRSEDRQKALTLLPSITPVATTHTWTFSQYASLKRRAELIGIAKEMLNPVYLRGYCVSGGIVLGRQGNLSLLFELRKGVLDQYLEWPSNFQIRFSIHQPQGTEKVEYCGVPGLAYSPSIFEPYHVHLCTQSIDVNTEVLLKRGFINYDRMLLSLALEPIGDKEP